MKVKIGIADTERVIELRVDDATEFEATVESYFKGDGALLWFDDDEGRRVGVPRDRVAFVEIDRGDGGRRVGFGT